MPTDNTALDRVKDLLANGQTEAAADLLLDFSKSGDPDHYNAALLLKNRVETLQHSIIEGVLSHSEERIEWARVSKGIVELASQIERGEKPMSMEKVIPPASDVKTGIPKYLLWLAPLLVVIGLFATNRIMMPDNKSNATKTEEPASPKMTAITGRVISSRTNRPIPGAKVILNDKFITTTDKKGIYNISVPEKLMGQQVGMKIIVDGEVLENELLRLDRRNFETLKASK